MGKTTLLKRFEEADRQKNHVLFLDYSEFLSETVACDRKRQGLDAGCKITQQAYSAWYLKKLEKKTGMHTFVDRSPLSGVLYSIVWIDDEVERKEKLDGE